MRNNLDPSGMKSSPKFSAVSSTNSNASVVDGKELSATTHPMAKVAYS